VDDSNSFAVLGRFDLNGNSQNWLKRILLEQIIHPEYKYTRQFVDANFGLLIMDSAVEYTNDIQPICLPPTIQKAFVKNAYILSYDLSAYGHPVEKTLILDNTQECYGDDFHRSLTSSRHVCVKSENLPICRGKYKQFNFNLNFKILW
jgi:hypothetical protein